MRKRALFLPAFAGLLLLSGCVNLDEVATLRSVSSQARTALPLVSDDFYASCERRAAIAKRIPSNELPPDAAEFGAIAPDCAPYKTLTERLATDSKILTSYLDALARLASNQPSFNKAVDADITAINGLTVSSNGNATLAADAQKASTAALSLTEKLTDIATRHYREHELRKLILESNDSVQQLTKALKTVVTGDYSIMLNSEQGYLDAFYQGPMAEAQSHHTERLALMLVQRQYDADDRQIQTRRQAAADYGKVMDKIAALHSKLAAAARAHSNFPDAVKQLAPDFADLKDAVTTLQAKVKG